MDYAVKITVKNGRLLRAMRAAGYETQVELARDAGMTQTNLGALLNMRVPAFNRWGEWSTDAMRLSSALRCEPEELFNNQQRLAALERNSAEVFMDEGQIANIIGGDVERGSWAKIEVERLLGGLTDRERKIVTARMDGATLEEVGIEDGVTRDRIRQIEMKAFRKMRAKAAREGKEFARAITA